MTGTLIPKPSVPTQVVVRPAAVALQIKAQAGFLSLSGAPTVAFEATFPTPAGSWIIAVPASFGRRPNVAVYLATGEEVHADVTASTSTVTVTFATPTAGTAVLT